jgi:Spy/CpxP family protein refolding chaperone
MHMRCVAAIAVFSLAFAAPMLAQTPQGDANPGGPRRFQPPPDHWMTIDSLGQALALTPAQRAKVTPPYTALNGVMKDAAARRQAIRQQMQASGFTPGQEPTPEQRARMDSVRAEMDGFQAEADQWVTAIRNTLTAAQQAKLDSLPKPRLAFRRPGGGPPPQ